MSVTNFVDTHPLRGAFVANQLERLVDLIVLQGLTLLEDAGLVFPSRAVSAVLLIGEHGTLSAADIASALAQPHQLVTQRIELLIGLGVVERVTDPTDGRRKLIELTSFGRDQLKRLQARLVESEQAFSALFAEIQCDLPSIAKRAMDALERAPLLNRIQALNPKTTPSIHTK